MKTPKSVFFLALLLICSLSIMAQQKVILQSAGTTRVFGGSNPFNDAYTAAASGDTIYLPGGNLPYPQTIDKGLVIYGAGFNPDSTTATGPTNLGGDMLLSENADNLKLEGIHISGNLYINNNHKINNLSIKRCRLASLNYPGDGITSPCENNLITECIVNGNISLYNLKNSIISNCIIQGNVSGGRELVFSNNLFLLNTDNWNWNFNDTDNSLISNNIFRRDQLPDVIHSACESNTFSNNVFKGNPPVGFNTFTGNFTGVDVASLFVLQSGAAFDFKHDYHLVNPAAYLGTDGTQVGIYGGSFPFKSNTMPSNPHIVSKAIPPHPDSSGNLQVQLKVSAQNN